MDLEDWINFGALMAIVIGSCLFFGGLYIVLYAMAMVLGAIPKMILQIFHILKGEKRWKNRK